MRARITFLIFSEYCGKRSCRISPMAFENAFRMSSGRSLNFDSISEYDTRSL